MNARTHLNWLGPVVLTVSALLLVGSGCGASRVQAQSGDIAETANAGPCEAEIDGDLDGSIDQRRRYHYDASHRLVRLDVTVGDSAEPDQWTLFEHDDMGRVVAERRFWRGEPDLVTTYVLDEQGRRTRAESADPVSGEVDTRIQYAYDLQNNLVREEWFYGDNEYADEVRLHRYDDRARQVASERHDGEGAVFEYRVMTYDAAGNLLREELGPRPGQVYGVIEYTYDCWR